MSLAKPRMVDNQIITIQQCQDGVTIELNRDEALVILGIIGRLTGSGKSRNITDKLYDEIRKALGIQHNQILSCPFVDLFGDSKRRLNGEIPTIESL